MSRGFYEWNDLIDMGKVFSTETCRSLEKSVREGKLRRERLTSFGERNVFVDRFPSSNVACAHIRVGPSNAGSVKFTATGSYRFLACRSGGWLALSLNSNTPSFWIPRKPMSRRLDKDGHILEERDAKLQSLTVGPYNSCIDVKNNPDFYLDWLVWRIPEDEAFLIESLQQLLTIETQPIFLWGSHTVYQHLADVYQHLIFGHVYENRYLWPHHRKSCSENDAHALYVTLSGLQRASGKQLYGLLKDQLLLSVLSRQAEDGGWHHGEWSEEMEAHLRLNGSAIHLLLDSLAEQNDPEVTAALEKALCFVSRHKDELAVGTWLLHDSLELSEAAMMKTPFKWVASHALEKSPSNMLVLNTHLDSSIVLDRYREITGDPSHAKLLESAKEATRAVLALRPLECLYRIVFWPLHLILLPTQVQRNLPLLLRALKRLASKWLKPNLYRLTARYPRFVMPGGYIERALALKGMADDYHSINVMDLARYARRFPSEKVDEVIHNAVEFVRRYEVDGHWVKNKWKNYAVGFWAEAIYHWYMLGPENRKLSYLAQVIIKLEENGIGLPPSLLGGNAEAIPFRDQLAALSPTDCNLRIANLSRTDRVELLIVNATNIKRTLRWQNVPSIRLHWCSDEGRSIDGDTDIPIHGRAWIVGCGVRNNEVGVEFKMPGPIGKERIAYETL